MTWGTDFTADIFLIREEYQNVVQLDDAITEIDADIKKYETQINMFASATPKDIIPEDWTEEPIRWIADQIFLIITEYNELIIRRYNLELYKEYLQKDEK